MNSSWTQSGNGDSCNLPLMEWMRRIFPRLSSVNSANITLRVYSVYLQICAHVQICIETVLYMWSCVYEICRSFHRGYAWESFISMQEASTTPFWTKDNNLFCMGIWSKLLESTLVVNAKLLNWFYTAQHIIDASIIVDFPCKYLE